MDILFKIIAIAFISWILMSPPLLIYYLFSRDKESMVACFCNKNSYGLFIGTLFSFTTIIGFGLSELLVFIPDSWGFINEDGEHMPFRKYISYIISFIASIGILFVLEGYNSYKRENFELKKKIQTLKKDNRSRKKSNNKIFKNEDK